MKRSAVSFLALLATFGLAGCGDPVTQLVVVVDTDLMVPEQINQIRISVLRAGSSVREQLDFGIYPVDAATMPLTVGVLVPEELTDEEGRIVGEEPARVGVEVTATGPMDRDRVVSLVEAEYLEGASLEVPVFIAGVCRRVNCPLGQSCGMGGCVPLADLTPAVMQWSGDVEMLETIPPAPPMEETEE